jgi:hypothetical protein
MKILRERMLDAFEKFDKGKVDFHHIHALAKVSETIVSGLKAEMQYSILNNQQPQIDFFGKTSGIPLEVNATKKLLT